MKDFGSQHLSLHNKKQTQSQTLSTLNFFAFKSEMIWAFVLTSSVGGYFAIIRPIRPRESSEKWRTGNACRGNPEYEKAFCLVKLPKSRDDTRKTAGQIPRTIWCLEAKMKCLGIAANMRF